MLPNGEETEIGEKGINLSGGQKARVSLARAAYSDAEIVLMDDSLSAVDAYVGKTLLDTLLLNGPLADKTRVLVTHALHVLDKTDYIYVMDEGAIVEQGTYAVRCALYLSALSSSLTGMGFAGPNGERPGVLTSYGGVREPREAGGRRRGSRGEEIESSGCEGVDRQRVPGQTAREDNTSVDAGGGAAHGSGVVVCVHEILQLRGRAPYVPAGPAVDHAGAGCTGCVSFLL